MSKSKAQDRREHIARMRADDKRRERRVALLSWGIGGLVIVILVGLVGVYLVQQRQGSDLGAVQTFKYKGGVHKEEAIKYPETPPVGGDHAPPPKWQNCGIYDQPISSESAVHSLEHGAVWITYRPDLAKDQVDALRSVVGTQTYILLSPFQGLPSPIVLSSWNKQLKIEKADDPRIRAFIKEFKNGPETPEPGAACSQGVGTPLPPV
ncbi:DUF3105 domain-containing protein [Rhizohabitans arisaemae]|uniref:DUF3105 domain-containing protein n=1 Tax=Rhizohabitans arisaemae TaxID=2720610 RepID=UPI0024B18D5B|nr:DUF3105 domain-containing protein [Rhizohabitans arisaemae]